MDEDQRAIDPATLSLLDPAVSECPYPAYTVLRDEAPVWKDNWTGMYVVSRYEDVRAVLLDTERFPSAQHRGRVDPRSAKLRQLYRDKGWIPAPTLAARDDPEHREMRGLFNHAFRPAKIRELDSFIESLAHRLIDQFIDRTPDGRSRRRHLADQGLDGCVGPAPWAHAERGGGDLVD